MKIQDKNIVVTGAASGIGKALAKSFSNHNANSIVLVDIDENALKASASEVNGLAIVGDISNEETIV